VVVRHLPPGVTQPMFVEQIDLAFSGRYNWLSFRPGKSRLGFACFLFYFT
jgi:regulator of nonsense transcripts 3